MYRIDRFGPRRPIRRRVPVAAMLATLLLACAACPFTPAEPLLAPERTAPSPSLWHELFAALARRADQGDARAARLALEMYRAGESAYGQRFGATPAQLQRWQCRAAGRDTPCQPMAAA